MKLLTFLDIVLRIRHECPICLEKTARRMSDNREGYKRYNLHSVQTRNNKTNNEMTNAELIAKIKAEIERRIHETSHPLKDGYEIQSIGKIEGLSELLDFLDTLQEPDFPATDEEMEAFLASHPKVEVPEKYKTPDWLFKKLEQEPKVDFKQEEERYWKYMTNGADMIRLDFVMFDKLARHFYGFGKNAK